MDEDPNEAKKALRRGIALGLTHIDTAELYGDGFVEELVGAAVDGSRDEIFLVSKVAPSNASYAGTICACERSLKRLRTDRLDLYLLHWRGSHPLAETMRAFEDLVRDGKILAYGVSNFDAADLDEAHALVGDGKLACDQVLYHLEERTIEHTVLPWCEEHGLAVTGYSPFGSGHFPSPRSAGGRVLQEIARAHEATPRQVALRFLTRRCSLFTIPKSSGVAHIEENAAAASLHLTADDLQRIDNAFPLARYRGLPML